MKRSIISSSLLAIGQYCFANYPVSHFNLSYSGYCAELIFFFDDDDFDKFKKCFDELSSCDIVKCYDGRVISGHLENTHCTTLEVRIDFID